MNGKVKQLLAIGMVGVLLLGEIPVRAVASEVSVENAIEQMQTVMENETSVDVESGYGTDFTGTEVEVSEAGVSDTSEVVELSEQRETEASEQTVTEESERTEENESKETTETSEESEQTGISEPRDVSEQEETESSEPTDASEKEETENSEPTDAAEQEETESNEETDATEQENAGEDVEFVEVKNETEVDLDSEQIEDIGETVIKGKTGNDIETMSIVESGTCGENATWVLDDEGTLTISGTGEMYDYGVNNNSPWYNSDVWKVVIESGITSIGNRAFYYCHLSDGIEIPEGVTCIGKYAFCDCYLKNVTFPESLEEIDEYAFQYSYIEKVIIPTKTTYIGWGAFSCCRYLTSINVSSGNTAYKSVDGVLFDKSMSTLCQYPVGRSDKEYIVPTGTRLIESFAFCNACLENVILPQTLEHINPYAFIFSDIKKIAIPSNLNYVEGSSFDGCTSFVEFSVDSNNETYCAVDGVLFSKDKSQIWIYPMGKSETEYVIPGGVESIQERAFLKAKLTKIVIPKTVKCISGYAFNYCANLSEINIPKSVKSIGRQAFASCSSLTTLTIPSSVTEIGEEVFAGCTNLTISCVKDSAMHKYAIENSIPYVLVEEEPDEYQITFDTKGGSSVASQSVAEGGKITKPTNPTRKGYQFVGWYKESSCKNKYDFNTTVNSDITLYAKWKANKYSIIFNGNGSTSGSMAKMTSCSYGKSYTLTANAYKKTGYTFAGWNTKKDGTGTSYKNKASIKNLTAKNEGTVKLYAQWKKPEYKITYKLNGGTNNSKNPSTYYETSATIKLKNPTKKGYEFKGWYSDSKYKNKVTTIKKGSKGNKTFYAKWEKIKYTITYNIDGGKNNKNNPRNYTITSADIVLKEPSKKGYAFKGWYSDSKYKKKVTTIKKGSTGNKTLYAKWEKAKYTITYELNGGKDTRKSKNNPKTYTITTKTTQLEAPGKTGYTFTGWYTDKKCSKKNKITKITKGSTGNLKLYAGWKVHQFTIIYDGNGSTNGTMTKQSMTYGTKTKLYANKYTKKGYIFKGWSTTKTGDVKYKDKVDGSKITSKDGVKITLYAKWEKAKYTITYQNLFDGKNNANNPSYYYITDDTIKLQSPKRSGYTFAGWYSDALYKNKIIQIKKGSTGNKEVYAKWNAISYQIVFDGNGATDGTMSTLSNCKYDKDITLPAVGFSNGNKKFVGWNTKQDGSGTSYADGTVVKNLTAKEGTKVTLYAQWSNYGELLASVALGETKDEIYIQSGNWATDVGGMYNKYNEKSGKQWCAYFVMWCAKEAGIPTDIIPADASATSMYNTMVNQLNATRVDTAQAGDLVFYYDNGNPNVYVHVGIMTGETESVQGNVFYNGKSYLQKMQVNQYLDENYKARPYVILRPNY